MRAKRIVTMLLVVVMLVSSMSAMAFAGTEETQFPNVYAAMSMGNWDCEHSADFYGQENVKLVLSKESTGFSAEIPLTYDEDLQWYSAELNDPALDEVIKEVGPVYNETYDGATLLESCGYTVTVEGIDAEHFSDMEVSCDVMTAETLKTTVDFITQMLVEMIQEEDPSFEGWESFDELLAAYEEILKDPEMGYTDEEIEEELAGIASYFEMVEQLENGTYAGELMFSVYANCTCAAKVDYVVYHEYYDADGNYVAQESEFLQAADGETIQVADLATVTEYDGVKYEVEGYYTLDPETYDWDFENPITEFTVSEYEYAEVMIKYVPADDTDETVPVDNDTDNDDENVQTEEVTEETEETAVDTGVPKTGDETSIAMYVLLMAAAAFGLKKVRA